jgi:DNA polymerase-3 subunit gamma/tau
MAQRRKDEPAPVKEASDRPDTYTVLARRYRPQQFADVVGQEAVARSLVNALEGNRVAHAYLFTGARGVGKTSMARILAKALNCVKGPTPTPCDVCSSCQAIAGGDDVDVIEIDGASNNKVDEIRDIRQNVQFRPSRSHYKIYIIDEVHMLTTQAFNALLKTLEEPPAHVKFIFATTEVQKIPVTILSRCQRFDFVGIGSQKIVERLREVVTAEEMQADDDALELVARRAGGSMRDAQSLLDQLLAFGGDRLTADQVHQLLGTAHDDRVAALADAVLSHNAGQALELLGDAAGSGLQLGELLDQLIDYWRDLMVVQCAGDAARDLSVPPRLRPTLTKQAQSVSTDTLLAGLDVLSTTKMRLRGSSHARVLLEMALVRLGRLDDLVSLAQLGQWLSRGGTPPPTVASGPPGPSSVTVRPPSSVVPRLSQALDEKKKLSDTGKEPPSPAGGGGLGGGVNAVPRGHVHPSPQPPRPAGEGEKESGAGPEAIEEIWRKTMAQMPPMLASQLEKAQIPAISGPNTLVIRFASEYSKQHEHCQEPKRLALIEEKLRQVAGAAWSLRVESIASQQPAAPTPSAAPPDSSQANSRRQREEALKQEPLVRRALDVLDAVIVRVDEGFGAAPSSTSPEERTPEEA